MVISTLGKSVCEILKVIRTTVIQERKVIGTIGRREPGREVEQKRDQMTRISLHDTLTLSTLQGMCYDNVLIAVQHYIYNWAYRALVHLLTLYTIDTLFMFLAYNITSHHIR